ncbi:MAG: hypothetical protein KME26_20800 [Oscillatoria princeps RMCB-10]|nr:hypothetical protein [Oscillatoria princeps RMCB-10]
MAVSSYLGYCLSGNKINAGWWLKSADYHVRSLCFLPPSNNLQFSWAEKPAKGSSHPHYPATEFQSSPAPRYPKTRVSPPPLSPVSGIALTGSAAEVPVFPLPLNPA